MRTPIGSQCYVFALDTEWNLIDYYVWVCPDTLKKAMLYGCLPQAFWHEGHDTFTRMTCVDYARPAPHTQTHGGFRGRLSYMTLHWRETQTANTRAATK